MTFHEYYKIVKNKLENEQKEYNKKIINEDNSEIKFAMEEFSRMNQGGKFLRGTLVAMGYNVNKKDDKYIPLSLAIETFQTAILIHDDIIDNALVRRGKKTIPESYKKKYNKAPKDKLKHTSNSMALCIADIGLYESVNIIVNNYKDNLDKILPYYMEISINTMKGELLDIILPFKEENIGTESNLEQKIFEIYKLKTAYYSIVGPYMLGMLLGGSSKEEVKEIEDILINIGIAYQIKDDIMGIYGDEKHIGKTNSDIEEYKQTILYAHATNTEYKEELKKYYGKNNTVEKIQGLFVKSGSKEYAENKMKELYEESLNKINKTKVLPEENKKLLKEFINYLIERTK